MIKVNTSHIGPEGLTLEGEENSAILELTDVRTGVAHGKIKYRLHCSMAVNDLVVLGTVKVPLKAECGRCLKEVDTFIEVKSVCHHFECVTDKEIDLTADIREDLLVALPTTFLCDSGCKGLCAHCGADLNEGRCKCKKEKAGPSAWDALGGLKL